MAEISAKEVAALRKLTGAGMMDCKKALTECDGDIEAAKVWLRERNLAGAAKRAGREADQGAIDVVNTGSVAALVELNCETDFVAKGEPFKAMVAKLAAHVAETSDSDVAGSDFGGATVEATITEFSGTLGEKMSLGRVVRYETGDGLLDAYKHIQETRGVIGVLVELGGVDRSDAAAQELVHDIALHIASARPRYVSRDDVPDDEVEAERKVYEAQTREEGKPEQAIGKIVDGKMNKFFQDNVLLAQGFVKDPKTTIAALIAAAGADAQVRRFARVKIGED